LREVSIAVRTLRLSCRKAGKAPIFTPVRESIPVKLPLTPYVRDAFWGGDERTPILRSQRAISLALVDDGEAAAHRRRHRKGNVLDAERLKDASCGFSAR